MESSAIGMSTRSGWRGGVGWLGWAGFFGLVLLVARYWHSGQMGFYEDDYTLVTRAMASTWPEVSDFVGGLLLGFGGQGRPLQHSLIYLLSWIAGQFGGLPQAYWLGWAILTLNSVLAFALLRRLFPLAAALAGGLAFALYGADTTQAFLYHAFGLQQSLTYLLIALHLYLADRKVLPYIVIAGALLSYETTFPVFLAAPLLTSRRGKALAREFGRHAGILAVLFLAVFVLRLLAEEQRVAGLAITDILTLPTLHMLQGTVVSLGTYFYRPYQTLQAVDGEMAVVLAGSLLSLGAVFWLTSGTSLAVPAELLLAIRRRSVDAVGQPTRWLLRLAAGGVAMIALAYPLTFTVRAYAISGRDTRVHFAAVVGAAIVWAVGTDLLLGLAASPSRRRMLNAGLAGYFTLMVGFGFVVQRSYVRAWELQQSFWTDVVRLCPDLDDGTVILVGPDGLEDPRFIYANQWNLPRVLEQVFAFPLDWEIPPRVYRLAADWEASIVTQDGRFLLDASTVVAPRATYETVDPAQVIVLRSAGGRLERAPGELIVQGTPYQTRPVPDAIPAAFPPGFLYQELVGGGLAGLLP